MGRREEALESAWSEYVEHPGVYVLEELLRYVPAGERDAWREKALDAARGDLHSVMDLFVETKERTRLVGLVEGSTDIELENVSHYATEPAARLLQKDHPAAAARLWRAQALRIVDAGKSKYYGAAVRNLKRARDCFKRAGRERDWEETVIAIRKEHFRKRAFMGDFELVARGESLKQPSFLEAARENWNNQGRKSGG
jgi:uncharacterized Zn finger protein